MEMAWSLLVTLLALGLGGGFLSGLLGLGGAIFMIPLLLYVPPPSSRSPSTTRAKAIPAAGRL
jgi:uncharacterized membrane protein YfcA